MKTSIYNEKLYTIISIFGDIDLYNVTDTKKEIWDFIKTLDNKMRILLDFKNVKYIDSSGIGLLINIIVKLNANSKRICIVNVTNDVQKVLKLTSLNGFLPVEETVTEALSYLDQV